MAWFSVQYVIRHRDASAGAALYEERTLIYDTTDAMQASRKAQTELSSYLDSNPGFSLCGEMSVFALNHESRDLEGAEVWSCMWRGAASSEEFWKERYKRFSLDADAE